MTPERWTLVRTIFEQALDLEPGARCAFVKSASANDPEVEEGVGRLLAADEEAGDFLEGSALGDAGTREDAEDESVDRRRVGPYEILDSIGHGGMGTVYRARRSDGEFRSEVALKVVRRGMDSAFILHRFRTERQILAGLSHPNIARLLDGGTTDDGMPYFVMELVEGQDLLSFCESRKLSVPDRLRLFRVVCEAVHFAHRSLVVHRDLKPANILVTADGTPKLLDFGLAKLLSASETGETMALTVQQGLRLLTPEYASPEQIRGEAITTSSDIYSLGVVLYELLSGTKPHVARKDRTGDLARAVCEDDPKPPGEAVPGRRLDPDLDTIVLMALRKEPERRYASVEQLSADIRRFLEGRPVSARKDTLGYRTAKFIRRHRVSVAAAALVTVSLVGGLAAALWQMRVAQRERARAGEHFAEVRRLATSFLFEHHDAIASLPGATQARALLVKRGLEYLEILSREAGTDRSLRGELAEAYQRLADVQSGVTNPSEGDSAGARKSYEKALALREGLVAERPEDEAERGRLAEGQIRFAGLLAKTGRMEEALSWGRRAVSTREVLFAEYPDALHEAQLGAAQQRHAWALSAHRELGAARSLLEKSIKHLESACASPAPAPWFPHALAFAYSDLGNCLDRLADFEGALALYHKAVNVNRDILARDSSNARARTRLVANLVDLASTQRTLGRHEDALASAEEARTTGEKLAAEDSRNVQAQAILALAHAELGMSLFEMGQVPAGRALLETAISSLAGILAADPENAYAASHLADTLEELGARLFPSRADRARACEALRRSAEIYSGLERDRRSMTGSADRAEAARAKLAACGPA